MPDGDVIRRGVRFTWRPAYEGLASAGPDIDARGLVAKGLTASLRARPIPQLMEASALVRQVWSGQLSTSDALDRVATMVGSVGGTRNDAMVDIALRHVIVAGPTGALPDQAVAEAYLIALIEAELFAKVRPEVIERRKLDPMRVEPFIAWCIDEAQESIRSIAQQIVADPTGARLRAPSSRGRKKKKKGTAQMLDESI